MVYSKIYGFLPPSKMIDVDDGVAAVGYKSLSTPPLLILNRRTPIYNTVGIVCGGWVGLIWYSSLSRIFGTIQRSFLHSLQLGCHQVPPKESGTTVSLYVKLLRTGLW